MKKKQSASPDINILQENEVNVCEFHEPMEKFEEEQLLKHAIPDLTKHSKKIDQMSYQEFTKLFEFDKDLTNEQVKQGKDLLWKYRKAFANSDEELTGTKSFEMEIPFKEEPVMKKPYSVPHKYKKFVEDQVRTLENLGLIRSSISKYASPITVVSKKNGDLRMCVNYIAINKATEKKKYPLPRIDEMMIKLQKSAYFSAIDMRAGYWQMPIIEKDWHKTAFVCHLGKKEFTYATPFGLTGASDHFQFGMHKVLGDMYMTICVGLLDDLNILGDTWKSHLDNTEAILVTFKHGLKLKPSKCQFFRKEVNFMGHTVNRDGMRPEISKIKVLSNWKPPQNREEMQRFLGFINYYRTWIPKFAHLTKNMYESTSPKVKFQWTKDMQEKFIQLINIVQNRPILHYPDPEKQFTIYTDASNDAIGAVVMQEFNSELHPVSYIAKHLTGYQKNWTVLDKEFFAMFYTLSSLEQMLLGSEIILNTDHKALLYIFKNPKNLKGKHYRWMLTCQQHNLTVKYIQGPSNVVADALSRSLNYILHQRALHVGDKNTIMNAQAKEKFCDFIKQFKNNEEYPKFENRAEQVLFNKFVNDWHIADGIVQVAMTNAHGITRYLTYLPNDLARSWMKYIHSSIYGGHFSIKRTLSAFRESFVSLNDYTLAQKVINDCIKCHVSKEGPSLRPRLQPFPIKSEPLEVYGLDMLGPFHESAEGYRHVLVMVDYCTKWPVCIPTKTRQAEEIASCILKHVIPIYGTPRTILSDNARELVSKTLKLLYNKMGIEKKDIPAYTPMVNGQTERLMKPVTTCLRIFCIDNDDWADNLFAFLTAYRNTVNSSSLLSPFFALYGRDMGTPYKYLLSATEPFEPVGKSQEGFINDQLKRLKEAHELVSQNNMEAKKKQKEYYDIKAKESKLEVGMTCVIKNKQPAIGKSKKLLPLFHRPSRIIEVLKTQVKVKNLINNKETFEHKTNIKIVPEQALLNYIKQEVTQRSVRVTDMVHSSNNILNDLKNLYKDSNVLNSICFCNYHFHV